MNDRMWYGHAESGSNFPVYDDELEHVLAGGKPFPLRVRPIETVEEREDLIRAAFAPIRIVREEPRLWRKLARLALTSAGYVALCAGRRVRDVGHAAINIGSRIANTEEI